MRKYTAKDHKALAYWAADCAERVLPFFEMENPDDDRPRKAIETCRIWIRTGVFLMKDIRGASLAAHAAARNAKANSAACFAARAAGQAVATAHVPQHAYGSAYYALKAIAASDPTNAGSKVVQEREWESLQLPENLRQEIMDRIVIQKRRKRIFIRIIKGKDF